MFFRTTNPLTAGVRRRRQRPKLETFSRMNQDHIEDADADADAASPEDTPVAVIPDEAEEARDEAAPTVDTSNPG